jgi:uncharacterized protein (TIGR03435 family)
MTVSSFACQMSFSHRPMMRVAGTVALSSLVVLAFSTMPLKAQITTGETPSVKSHTTPAGQKNVGSNLAFEVASVRQNKSDEKPYMNVSPVLGDSPVSTGGLYSGRNIPLIQFISFAYNLTQVQLQSVVSQVPWTAEDKFDIEARAAGDPDKAEYRLMMQSLLADRFKLVVHRENRQVPIYALVLAKPGKLGSQIRLHKPEDPVCKANPEPAFHGPIEVDAEGFPLACGGPLGMKASAPARMKDGGRDVAMTRFAAITTGVGEVDRPMVDETGIKGTVDYTLEWGKAYRGNGLTPDIQPDPNAPTFQEALKEQLGIKMVSKKGPQELFFIDHLERPSEN